MTRARKFRERATAVLAAVGTLAMTTGVVMLATATSASAHVPGVSASCAGVHITGTNYVASKANRWSVTINGKTESGTFGGSVDKTFPVPQNGTESTWSATVEAHDGGYKAHDSGKVGPCGKKPAPDCKTYPGPNCVTPVKPAVDLSKACDVEGTYTIPDTKNVQYYKDGAPIAAGTYDGPATGTITATATGGKELTDPGFSFALNVPAAADCPPNVSAVNPGVTQSTACDVEGSYTIASTAGVKYLKDGQPIAPGTYPGPATGTITAQAAAGFTLTNPGFSFKLDVPAAKDCPPNIPETTAVNPTVTVAEECEVEGTYTIPETKGVGYLKDGQPIAAGTYEGPASGTITAQAATGFKLTNPDFSYTLSLAAAEDCPTTSPTPEPTPTEATPEPEPEPTHATPVPTAVDAGLGGPTITASTPLDRQAMSLVGGGLALLMAAGWLRIGREKRGVHQA